jgi:PST family polysaccharide transporter
LWVPISQGIAMILSGMVCIGMIRRLGYQFQMPGWDDVREQLRGAASYFWVKIAGAHLSFAGVFSLGLVGSPAKVALYGSAEQVYRAIYAAYEPFYEALTAYTKRTNDVRMVRRLFAVVFGGTVLLGVLGMVLAPYLIDLLFGAAFAGATQNLQILLFGLLLGVPSGMISYPLLGSMGCGPQINRVIILSAIATLSVLGLLWHGNMLSGTAVALTMVASEAFKLSGLLLLLRRVRFQSQFA